MNDGIKGMIVGGAVAGLISGSIVAGAIFATSSGPREVYGDVGVSGPVEVDGPVEVTQGRGVFAVEIYCPERTATFAQPARPAGCE